MDAFVKEMKVMLRAFDQEKEADAVEEMYDKKREVILGDMVHYLKEVEHMEVL